MAIFNDERILAFNDSRENRSITVNGSVAVEAKIGDDWVLADRLTTGSYGYYTSGLVLKFIPDSGTTYKIEVD